LSKGAGISLSRANTFEKSEVYLKTFVDNNNRTRFSWEKETVLSNQVVQPSPINEHLVSVSQSNYDLWSNEFSDKLIFTLDSSASVLGLQLELDYDPTVFTIAEIDNYVLKEQHGFTFKNRNSEGGKYTISTVVLDIKEKLKKSIDSLFCIRLNPIKEIQTLLLYRWKVYDVNGDVITQGSDENQLTIQHTLPRRYALHQNFPNPFNPSTTIRYQLPVDSKVKMDIFNILGERVTTLVDEIQKAAYYSCEWNISKTSYGIASGIYFVRFVARGNDKRLFVDHKKVIVIK
jgi:hypothetical protein